MGKNQLWKKVLIVVLVLIAVLALFPLDQKLKPGLDLAGGTSLIYGIDTEGMEPEEAKGVASRMVPILMKRIDPTGVTNIVIRPQGDTRIEFQLPLASKDTRQKREKYQEAFEELQSANINLATVVKALSLDDKARQEAFEEFAHNPDQKEILKELASTYDARQEARKNRDKYSARLEELKDELSELDVNARSLDYRVKQWVSMEGEELDQAISDFASPEDTPEEKQEEPEDKEQIEAKKKLLKEYVNVYSNWAQTVNRLADKLTPEYNDALSRINELNLSVEAFAERLETAKRDEYIEQMKTKFPDRKEEISEFVAAYEAYSGVRGRLDGPEDLKRMLKGSGVLEFRILPTLSSGEISSDLAQAYKEDLEKRGPKFASDSQYKWCEIDEPETFGAGGAVTGTFAEKQYVLASNKPAETMLHKQDDQDWKLNKAYPTSDNMGRRAIGFQMNEIGAKMFFQLTSNSIGKPLCILLDGKAVSAPNVNDAIRSTGIITGRFSAVEQDNIVNKLNAGSLPARISEAPISEKTIGATIGEDYRDKGIRAGIIGVIVVAIFMVFYYRFSGSVADIALALNILFVLAIMAFSGATFTLPGIAGLILTIGMAVDANVLIFERIREEQLSGCSLKASIANGYSKAFRTIFDANLTTFITAMILYMVASEEIKGFAIVLMFGIISSMFTALFVTRVVFDTLIDKKLLKNHLGMFTILKNPTFDWMKLRRGFQIGSLILILCGLIVFFSRGSDKYDIEFTGGTSVQVNFKEGVSMDRADVEAAIRQEGRKMDSPGLIAAKVYSVGENDDKYEINTTETNKTSVDITFSEGDYTAESVKEAVEAAAGDIVKNISVKELPEAGKFLISTSQMTDSKMKTLAEDAFGEQGYVLGEPEVSEPVNDAILAALGDKLEKREDLGVEVKSTEMITNEVAEQSPELVQYLSGLKIKCELDRAVNASQLKERFNSLRFKPDLQDVPWYRYEIVGEDYQQLKEDEQISGFTFISMHPDAGYRDLDDNELEQFKENEIAKVEAASALETSLPRVTQVNPSIGSESQTKALIAIILSLFAIIAYIWVRFGDVAFGFAAIAALVHDVCITLGAISVCTYIAGTAFGEMIGIRDFKINLQMIAAFLTIIGYSLNDTIVVFDRIRENRGKNRLITPKLLSFSVNQTLSRTLLTSFTTFVVVLVMYIWGGIGLRGFTFAMLVGIIVGTYSSIAIAAPILLLGNSGKENNKNNKR